MRCALPDCETQAGDPQVFRLHLPTHPIGRLLVTRLVAVSTLVVMRFHRSAGLLTPARERTIEGWSSARSLARTSPAAVSSLGLDLCTRIAAGDV